MSDSFGVKMGLEGEREFKRALKEINDSFKVLGSEMNLVTSQFDKNEKSIQSLTARNTVLNKEIETQKSKIETLQSALRNAADSFGENDKRSKAWQVQLNNAQAELNHLNNELSQNESSIKESSENFQAAERNVDKFGKEVEETARESSNANSHFETLGTVVKGVAASIATAMAAIGAATMAAGKAIYDMANETAAIGDSVDKMSQSLGMSTNAYQEWEYVLSQNGADIESLKVGLNKLNNTVDDATNGGEQAAKKFERLGISMEDLKGKSREEVFAMTISGLQGITDEGEKAAIASDLLGRSSVDLAALLNQSVEGTTDLKERAHELGIVMSKEAVNAAVVYGDSMDDLKSSFQGVKNSIASELLPGFTNVVQGLTDLLTGQEGAEEKIKAGAQQTVQQITERLPNIVETAATLITAIAEIAPDIIKSLVQGILKSLPKLLDAAGNIISALIKGITSCLPELTKGALKILEFLIKAILENLPQITEAAIELVVTLATGIGEALPELIPAMVQAILVICETLLNNMDQILDAAFCIVEGLVTGILNAIPILVENLPAIITAIVTFLVNSIPKIIEMGVTLIGKLAAGLIQAIPQLVAQLPQIVSAILTGIGKAVTGVFDIGANIVRGIWDGICSLADWIADKISDFFGGIVDGVKGLLGIHSPSRVFADIGDNMAKGVGVGFTDEMSRVSKDIEQAIPTSFDSSANWNLTGQGSKTQVEHVGSIRVEGINQAGDLSGVVDIIINQLRQEVRV